MKYRSAMARPPIVRAEHWISRRWRGIVYRMRFVTGLLVAVLYDSIVLVLSGLISLRQQRAAGVSTLTVPTPPAWWWWLFLLPPVLFLVWWTRLPVARGGSGSSGSTSG